MKTVRLPGGEQVAALGMGTWMIGEQVRQRKAEIAALHAGLDAGLTLIDTAEMYGDGAAERLVGEVVCGRRDEVFLVSKVYPFNASRQAMVHACEDSLQRLGTDRLDAYLLHWPGNVPLEETLEAFSRLQSDGKIRYWGISNFDTPGMQAIRQISGDSVPVCNQVLYNLSRRGIEWDLLPYCRAHNIPLMAYSPLEQARLLTMPKLRTLADSLGITVSQLALAWLLRHDDCMVIPKTSTPARMKENAAALSVVVDASTLNALDHLFTPPSSATPLAML